MEKNKRTIEIVRHLAAKCNTLEYFKSDPIIYPRHFKQLMEKGGSDYTFPIPQNYIVTLKDVEIVAVIAAHLAWGRREMIVRDIGRAMDEMDWKPAEYINKGCYRHDDTSLHRTIKWSEFALICSNLRRFYTKNSTLEILTPDQMRVQIFGQQSNPKMANKKIHMLRRWMVRCDGIVDLGLWHSISPAELIIPLDVHVHNTALELGITERKGADYKTAEEITEFLCSCFPNDPCLGDFALFAYAAEKVREKEKAPQKSLHKECKKSLRQMQKNKEE